MSSKTRIQRAKPAKVSTERMYDIIQSPVITEKSTRVTEYNQITFKVPLDASKPEIKQAVESLFKVQVTGVNTLVQKGKNKRFRGIRGRRADVKKAVVTLAEGHTIDVTTGV
ncbi:MAG: 50S ribosomal protein L23 [Alphaproteobacteria bacterium]|jgi:large subunit ribosomal protein L23|nr:50S ribosomal protein L23 [Alphaproteobacteria bacterium]